MESQKQPKRSDISTAVMHCLKDLLSKKGKLPAESISESTILIGPASVLDSLELVTFVVELEQRFEGFSLILADDSAMLQKNSPYKTVQSLTNHIFSLMQNQQRQDVRT
jgi:acyl carrier protein